MNAKRVFCLLIAGVIILTTILSSLAGCSSQAAAVAAGNPRRGSGDAAAQMQSAAITVETAAPTVESLSLTTDYVGKIAPGESVEVRSTISGTVGAVYFEAGETVKAGDLLFEIDSADAALSLEKATVSYEQAKASYDSAVGGSAAASKELSLKNAVTQAVRNYNAIKEQVDLQVDFDFTSYSRLRRAYREAYQAWEAGTGSVDELYEAERALDYLTDELSDCSSLLTSLDNAFDNLEAARTEQEIYQTRTKQETAVSAELNLRSAELTYQQAQRQMNDYKIYSPIDGVIETKSVSQYATVSSASTAYVISNKDVMLVTFNVSADGASALSIGDSVTLTKGSTVTSAVIIEIDSKANSSTGLFPVSARLNEQTSLLSGVSVKVTASTARADDALIISVDDISYEDEKPYVLLYRNGKAVKAFIELGITTRVKAQVVSGLDASSQVITTWHPDLADGVSVALKSEAEQNTAAFAASDAPAPPAPQDGAAGKVEG